ncbi:hypothetical protein GCM10022198_11430 [Klugiella xanthotipulae]|uniref:EamA family transporter n=1 Tax=Klugiella xanthotipulae TaxID=244735 RepID=UPI001B87132A|nr:EamA family transporter [Klugiella xanthotipulae]
MLSLPFGLPKIAVVTSNEWLVLVTSAGIGVVIPYAVDTLAARVSSARVVGTLFSIDPVMGVLCGYLMLGQHIDRVALIGIFIVAGSGGLLVWISGDKGGHLKAKRDISDNEAQ